MKIRLIWDDCEPTIDRRPTTREDIETGIHLQEFESENDLIKHLCDLSDYDESDLEDYGEDNRAKIDFLLSSMSDPGDGTPNILFLSIDGDIIQDWLEEVDGLTCSEQDVKNEQMKSLEDEPWDYEEEFDFDDEDEEHLDEDLDEETTDNSDDLVTDELLAMLNDIDLETEDDIKFEENTSYSNGKYTLKILTKAGRDRLTKEDLYYTEWNGHKEISSAKGIKMTIKHNGLVKESINESKLEKVSPELFDDNKLINEEENQKPEWQIKKEKALEYYNKVKEWADDPKIKTACQYNIDVDRLNEWLGEDTDMIIKKQNEILTEDDNKDNTLKAAVDSAEKILDNPEVYSGSGDIERALDRALRTNKQQIRNGSRNFVNVLFTGPAGTGKTSRVAAWAKKNNINLVTIIASTLDDVDLGGVPAADLVAGIARKLSTSQFDSLGSEPDSVLFLDEWNRAPRGVRATLLNLIQNHEVPDSRQKTGMRFLPNFLFTVGAVNPSDDVGYNTDALDDAELGRVLEYEVAPDIKNWLDYVRAEFNSQIKHAEKNPNKDEAAQDIKEIKGRLGIIEKLVTDPRFSFDSQYDIEKSKEAKENKTGNGKILTYRNLLDVVDSSNGTKDDFLSLWDTKCNSLKKSTAEEILKDYKDVEDKDNATLDSGTESKVFASKEDKLNKLRDQMKNTRI